jgi:hypothetical protein
MKKTILTITLAVAMFGSAFAQKGSILLQGNVGAARTSNGAATPTLTTDLQFSPMIGYQFDDNLTAGIIFNSAGERITNNGTFISSNSLFMVGPFVRYSKAVTNLFSVYGQAEGMFGNFSSKVGSATSASLGTTGVNVYPAVLMNIKNGFGLNFNFGGLNYSSIEGAGNTSGINFGQTMNIGVSKLFHNNSAKKN